MNWEDENEMTPPSPYDQFNAEAMRKQLARMREEMQAAMYGIAPTCPPEHRTPSPATAYESLDHFLFQPDLHWNGKTVDRD